MSNVEHHPAIPYGIRIPEKCNNLIWILKVIFSTASYQNSSADLASGVLFQKSRNVALVKILIYWSAKVRKFHGKHSRNGKSLLRILYVE
jgi:hypothetical protein